MARKSIHSAFPRAVSIYLILKLINNKQAEMRTVTRTRQQQNL